MQFHNIHSHTFTMNNAPEHFLRLYMPDVAASLIDKITNTKPGAASMAWLLSHLGGNLGKKYASFLQIGKSLNQKEVFLNLRDQYSDKEMKFVALTMFMEECGVGASSSGFQGQLEELLLVKKEYPDHLLLFMGIDPRWLSGKALQQKVQSYFETLLKINSIRSVYPFVGLKLYPSTGFYVFDDRLTETLEWAQENEVPILSHCSYLGGIYNNDETYLKSNINPINPYTGQRYPATYQANRNWGRWLLGKNESTNNKNTCSYFLEPEGFRSVLTRFPKLKVCLAHYGGEDHILAQNGAKNLNPATLFGVKKMNWCGQIQALMTEFPNLYTDISFSLFNKDLHPFFIKDLSHPPFADRLLFGTDYYMTEQHKPEKELYDDFKKSAVNATLPNGKNAWEQIANANPENFLKSKYYP